MHSKCIVFECRITFHGVHTVYNNTNSSCNVLVVVVAGPLYNKHFNCAHAKSMYGVYILAYIFLIPALELRISTISTLGCGCMSDAYLIHCISVLPSIPKE